MSGHVLALSGGVGGAKLVHGLSLALAPGELTAVVNTGDDFRHLGLAVCPDIDSVVYALAGLSDPVRGWGRASETWTFMAALKSVGGEDWFQLGDGDLAMHVQRTRLLIQGCTLTEATGHICRALGLQVQVLPMSDDTVRTRVLTDEGWLDFQDYFVRRQCRPAVREFEFAGAAQARAQPEVLAALRRPDLRAVVICPSNPFVSVEPILAVPGMREVMERCAAPVVAVTPIIGGKAVKGPVAKMMRELGLEVNGESVARRYAGLIDAFVVDEGDARTPVDAVARGGLAMSVVRAPTLMTDRADRVRLAGAVLAVADALSGFK